MKFKKGDNIVVMIGKDKGRKGKIERIFPKKNKLLIPGINIYKRHTKPRGKDKTGGIIDKVLPLPAANVALLCPKCGKPTRIGYQIDREGNKLRICRKCRALV